MNLDAMKSFVLHNARCYAVKKGKECILDQEMQIGIIIEALHEFIELNKHLWVEDIAKLYEEKKLNNEIYEISKSQIKQQFPELYSELLAYNMAIIFDNKKILEPLLKELIIFHDNFGQKTYDTNMNEYEKKQILQNTITAFKKEFQLLKDNVDYDEYEKFIQKNIESRSSQKATTGKSKFEHLSIDFILGSMERKIDDEKELESILKSLELIDANFYIKYNDICIYPIILDLLVDTAAIDYQFYLDKSLIQSSIVVWRDAKIAQKLRFVFSKLQFYKIEWIEQITYSLSRSYLLHEYIKTLEQDPKKIQNFFQNILYNNKENSKNSPKIPPEHFNKITPRRFFLENTKMVLGKN